MSPNAPCLLPPLSVLRAADFMCEFGANSGDPLSFAEDLVLDDVYAFAPGADTGTLVLETTPDNRFLISADSAAGTPHARVHLDSVLSFMSPNESDLQEMLVLVEVDDAGHVADIHLAMLSPMDRSNLYHLVAIDRQAAPYTLAQVSAVSFAKGTRITMATGAQRLIENLRPGDHVLTRNDGVQPVRWIGHSTVRAVGALAPFKISAGALNNANDLIVSPDNRLLVYQRSDEVGAGQSELLIKARHLLNGTTVTRVTGGFVDYFQLVFDSHQIIYAEGIAAETMRITSGTRAMLPDDVATVIGDLLPRHAAGPLVGLDVEQTLLARADMTEMLRRASSR